MNRINLLDMIDDYYNTIEGNKNKEKSIADELVEDIYHEIIDEEMNVQIEGWLKGKKLNETIVIPYMPPTSIVKRYDNLGVNVNLSIPLNWDNYLFVETMISGYWSQSHYKLMESVDAIYNAQEWWYKKIKDEVGVSVPNSLCKDSIRNHFKILYQDIPVKERITQMMYIFLKRYFYWSLDCKYLLMLYCEYTRSTPRWESSRNEQNKIIKRLPYFDNIKQEEWIKMEMLDENQVYDSLYWRMIDNLHISNEDISVCNMPHWRCAFALFIHPVVRKALVVKKTERVDGYQYKQIKKAYIEISEALKDKNDVGVFKYWFESLFGMDLCVEESYYYTMIVEACSGDRRVKELLIEVFSFFNNMTNLCSRSIMLREFMEVVVVYRECKGDIISVLELLKALLPEFVECVNSVYCLLAERLFDAAERYDITIAPQKLYEEWKEQMHNHEVRKSKDYTEMQKRYIRE